jgi:hypothetical protein
MGASRQGNTCTISTVVLHFFPLVCGDGFPPCVLILSGIEAKRPDPLVLISPTLYSTSAHALFFRAKSTFYHRTLSLCCY